MKPNGNVTKYTPLKENILLMFHDVQKSDKLYNHVSPDQLSEIAEYLNLSLAETEGILSFYRYFSTKPRGKYVIRLCDSLSCRITGSVDVYNLLHKRLGIKNGETTSDKIFTIEIVNCLGSCDTAPNMMVNDNLYTNLNEQKVDLLLQTLYEEAQK